MDLLPFYRRWAPCLRRWAYSWLGRPVPSAYIENPLPDALLFPDGYLLLEFIEPSRGQPLSKT